MQLAAALILSLTFYVPVNPVGAMGEPILPGLTCAVSRDLAHLKGSWLHIDGHGPRYVNDIMGPKARPLSADLAVADRQEALDLGRTRAAAWRLPE